MTTTDTAKLAADVLVALPQTAQLLRNSATSDGHGGRTASWSVVATYPCRVSPQRSNVPEEEDADRLRDDMRYRLALPAGTTIYSTDRVQVGSQLYTIDSVQDNASVEVERAVWITKAPK